ADAALWADAGFAWGFDGDGRSAAAVRGFWDVGGVFQARAGYAGGGAAGGAWAGVGGFRGGGIPRDHHDGFRRKDFRAGAFGAVAYFLRADAGCDPGPWASSGRPWRCARETAHPGGSQ